MRVRYRPVYPGLLLSGLLSVFVRVFGLSDLTLVNSAGGITWNFGSILVGLWSVLLLLS